MIHVPISAECLFSRTLLPGEPAGGPRHRVHLRVTEPSRESSRNEGGREGTEGTGAGLGPEWREMQCCKHWNAGKCESQVPAYTRGSVLLSLTVNNAKMGNGKMGSGNGTRERDASAQLTQTAQARQSRMNNDRMKKARCNVCNV